jgi:hypothetical protein
MLKQLLIAAIILLFTACWAEKQAATPIVKQDGERIIGFGAGGGIAGHYGNYYLYNNGKLTYNEGFPQAEPVAKEEYNVNQKQVDSLFREIDKISIKTLDFNYPSNMSYFLALKEMDKTYTITWGGDKHPPDNVEKLYDKLNEIATKVRIK